MKTLSIAVFHVLATLCAGLAQKLKPSGFYTVQVVSPNLALLGAQYSFELEGTLGAQDPLSLKIYLTRWTPFVLDIPESGN